MATYSGISIAERDRYRAIFMSLGPVDGLVTGDQARATLLKSGLDAAQLERIWALADMQRRGALDLEEWIIAMRLTIDAINGAAIPPVLPGYMVPPAKHAAMRAMGHDPLAQAAGVPGIPTLDTTGGTFHQQLAAHALRAPTIEFTDSFDWYMPPAEKLKYEMEFERAPTNNGLLSKPHVYEAFALSRRPPEEFDVIWNIIDVHTAGAINADQYAAFQHIVNARKTNKPFPRELAPELLATFKQPRTAWFSTRPMSKSTSRDSLQQRSSQEDVSQKVMALENELSLVQAEIDALSSITAPPSVAGEYEALAAQLQECIEWMNEHLPMLPSASSATDLVGMLKAAQDELAHANLVLTREKSTTI